MKITTDAWRAKPGQIGYLIRLGEGSYALYRNPPLDPDAGFRIARGPERRWSPCNIVVGCVRVEEVAPSAAGKVVVFCSPVPETEQPWVTRPERDGGRDLAFALR